jgi:hypothetical protein
MAAAAGSCSSAQSGVAAIFVRQNRGPDAGGEKSALTAALATENAAAVADGGGGVEGRGDVAAGATDGPADSCASAAASYFRRAAGASLFCAGLQPVEIRS